MKEAEIKARISQELHDQLAALAKTSGESMSWHLREACRQHIAKHLQRVAETPPPYGAQVSQSKMKRKKRRK